MDTETNADIYRTLIRLYVGVTAESYADCEWYEGILGDAIEEAHMLIDEVEAVEEF